MQLAPAAKRLRLRVPASVHLCARVYLCVKRVEPPDCTTCVSLCQQLNVCRTLFLFGTLSAYLGA